MKTRIVYRIENLEHMHGMWYDKEGNFDPIIQDLCPDGKAKDFPMPYDEQHKIKGKEWYSAGKSIDNMNEWFSREDAERLVENGFQLYKYEVSEFQELEMECLFTREGIVDKEIIPIDEVWQ